MTDLVVVSLEAWDQVWRRNQHLLAGLLRADPGLRVLLVEPPADPLYAVRSRRWPRPGHRLAPLSDVPGVGAGRLWTVQPTKWLPRRLDRRADARLARRIVRAAGRLRLHRPLLWVNDPVGALVLGATGWPTLYDITDDWLLADRPPRERARLEALEQTLLARAREVVVCSPALARSKGTVRPVTLVPNAVDVAAYHRVRERPLDLPAGPVALYAGTLHRDRLDLELTLATAAALAGIGRVVLLGPVALSAADAAALRGAGVVLLGARPAEAVPAYLRHADVLLVPHLVTPFTDSLDPIKAYEYRAAGRPVVATAVAGFAEGGPPRVTVVAAESFPAAVATAAKAAPDSPLLPPVDDTVPGWPQRVEAVQNVLRRLALQPAIGVEDGADGGGPAAHPPA